MQGVQPPNAVTSTASGVNHDTEPSTSPRLKASISVCRISSGVGPARRVVVADATTGLESERAQAASAIASPVTRSVRHLRLIETVPDLASVNRPLMPLGAPGD